jgi:hypothetical protein
MWFKPADSAEIQKGASIAETTSPALQSVPKDIFNKKIDENRACKIDDGR